MDEERTTRVWAAVNAVALRDGTAPSLQHACIACAETVAAFAAGLSMARSTGPREPVWTTGSHGDELQELQFTLGEGPCMDAVTEDRPVLIANLSSGESGRRWPAFAPSASQLGIVSMFSIPVRSGAVRFGVLDLYRRQPGFPTSAELADVCAFADAAVVLALDHRSGLATGVQDLLEAGFTTGRAEVHQAAGMVSAQLCIGITDALARLRAHAYRHDRRLHEVAADVVARRLRFHPETGPGGPDHDQTNPPTDSEEGGDR